MGVTISGVPSSVSPTKAIFSPVGGVDDPVGRQERVAGARVGDVRREVLEDGAVERCAVLAAVDRVAAVRPRRHVGRAAVGAAAAGAVAVLHPQQLGLPLVELVVADADRVEADVVHDVDRRLVVHQPRRERARTDQVTGGHDIRVDALGAEGLQVRGEVLGAAGG